MPIYRVTFPGVDNELFVRADSAAKAKDQVVTTEALTNDELVEALDNGLHVYKAGDSILGETPSPSTDTELIDPPTEKAARAARGLKSDPEKASEDA